MRVHGLGGSLQLFDENQRGARCPALVAAAPGEAIDDGQPKTFLLRQLAANGQVIEAIFTENLVLAPRMLLKLCAVSPLVSLLNHSIPPKPI